MKTKDLAGKTAIVTGSTAGIGLAAARALLEDGAKVVINGRTADRVQPAVDALRQRHPDVEGFVGDLSTAAGCEALVAVQPQCDVLVNNLGIYGPEDFFETSDETWQRFFETNVMSGVRLCRAYLPQMIDRGFGRVVFVSSESAINIPKDMVHYGFTKTAQLSIARGLAKRVAGTGVTINSVLPGPTLSEGLEAMLEAEANETGQSIDEVARAFVMRERPSSLIQRAASVDEVAHMIRYVCSTGASATSGAALRVDGGVVDSVI